jgi:hypothetical protein
MADTPPPLTAADIDLEDLADPEVEGQGVAPPNVEAVVVTARGGFQSLPAANTAFKNAFAAYEALADGTAGRVVKVPTLALPDLLRSLADILESEFPHQKSGEQVGAAYGIDNWVLAIQAIRPTP